MPSQNDLPAVSQEALKAFRTAAPQIIKECVDRALLDKANVAQHGDQAESLITAGLQFTTRMLDSAMSVGATALLADELAWAKDRLPHDGVSMQQVSSRLTIMREIIFNKLPRAEAREVVSYLDWMLERMEN
jgi:hypothetical protein